MGRGRRGRADLDAGGGLVGARQGRCTAKPAVDPDAIAALHKMGAFLRKQQKFAVQARMTTDDLLPSGQKVQYGGTVELMVRRPDRLRMDIRATAETSASIMTARPSRSSASASATTRRSRRRPRWPS